MKHLKNKEIARNIYNLKYRTIYLMEKNKHIGDLVYNCLVFVDQRGRIIEKTSNPMLSILEMEYKAGSLAFHFRAYSHCQGNGSLSLEVKDNEDVVFKADGTYIAGPYSMEAKIYKSGDWEKAIPMRRTR